MIPRRILVIDDEVSQAKALAKTLEQIIPFSKATPVSEEQEIINAINERYYNLAVLDIRMDNYNTNGIEIAKIIADINPYAKILFVLGLFMGMYPFRLSAC